VLAQASSLSRGNALGWRSLEGKASRQLQVRLRLCSCGKLGGLAGARPFPGVSPSSVLSHSSRTRSADSGPNLGVHLVLIRCAAA
jgi:hypothetical protein